MASVIQQLAETFSSSNAYKFGQITILYENSVDVLLTSGLTVRISDINTTYAIGDQVVLGVSDSNLNNLFILKKLDKSFPNAINYLVNLNED